MSEHAEAVARLVATAPPLTAEQRALLRSLPPAPPPSALPRAS
jgi:hypothetical protein